MRAMRRTESLDSVASILDGLAHRLGLEYKLLECRLRREWTALVGEQIAAHTRPEHIRFKKLLIHVRHSVWLQQLTFLKPALLEKVNSAAGDQLVSEIVLRIGEVAKQPVEDHLADTGTLDSTEPSDQLKSQAAYHARAVQDTSLREHLVAVMAQALLRCPPIS
jgi:predicted nucleic acid-binding Zn ribbon protein